MKTREDFMPDLTPARSIREIVLGELSFTTYNGKTFPEPEPLDELMSRVYAKIEKEALQVYKSNEPWALKAWAYANILKEETAKQAAIEDESLLEELVSPVKDWQSEHFDPLLNFRRKLELSGKRPGTVGEYMRAATSLVTKYGKKERYNEAELLEFLDDLHKRYPDKKLPDGDIIPSASYATKVQQLKSFLDSLPEDERGRRQILPINKLPPYPDIYHQPSFTDDEIESLCCAAVLNEKPESVLRLAIATIYGCRVGEIAKLSSQNINLDPDNPTINIPTEKRGRRAPQPIPKQLIPLFSLPLTPKKTYLIQRDLKRICRKASVVMQNRGGLHCIRRSVVTALYVNTDLKEIPIRRFMRWSPGGRDLGVMPRYVKTPVEVTDIEVLDKHPYVPIWEKLIDYMARLPQYKSCVQFNTFVR
jgi:integrase